jgi:hypothetical protein
MPEAEHAEEVRALIDFAEGRMSPREFEAALYATPCYEQVLGDSYLSALQGNYEDPGGVLNSHTTICGWLKSNGYNILPTKEHQNFYQLLLRAQPFWAGVPMKYLVEHVLPAFLHLQDGDLESALRAELEARFRFEKHPPNWLQGRDWPINEMARSSS